MFAENSDDIWAAQVLLNIPSIQALVPRSGSSADGVPPFRREQAKKMIDDIIDMLQKDIIP